MHLTSKSILNKWTEYTLSNEAGICIKFLNYGGIITRLISPNQDGVLENIVLGYKDYRDYEENPNYFGAIIGRVAGRIKGAVLPLDGKEYHIDKNEGENHLHGGANGFHQVIWDTEPFEEENEVGVRLSYSSPDGESGYPGKVDVTVTYSLTKQNEFVIQYEAVADETTALSLTNHMYLNFTGNMKETVDQHIVRMNSHHYIELDTNLIPTGHINDVKDTPFDFRDGRKLADGIHSSHAQNEIAGHGYDHYFLLHEHQPATIDVQEPTSGRALTIRTDQPGVVLYTGNGLDEQDVIREGKSQKHAGVCFETQAPSASLHNIKLPSILLEANKQYTKETVFAFHCN